MRGVHRFGPYVSMPYMSAHKMRLAVIVCTVPQSAEDSSLTAAISGVAASYTDKLNHCLKQTGDYFPPVSWCWHLSVSIPFCISIPGFSFC